MSGEEDDRETATLADVDESGDQAPQRGHPEPDGDSLPPTIEPEGDPEPARKPRPKWLIPVAAVVVVVVLVAAGLIAWRVSSGRSHDRTLASCSRQVHTLEGSEKQAAGSSSDYRQAVAVKADQVRDARTVTAMQKTVRDMKNVRPQVLRCEASMSTGDLRATTDKAKRLDDQYRSANKAAEAVLASRNAKSLDDATAALNAKKDEASKLLSDSDGKVADNATRDGLQQAIDQADQAKGGRAKDYQDAAGALQSAMDQVKASIQQKSQADQAAQQQAQAARQPTRRSVPAQQRSAPSTSRGRQGYTPSRRPSYNPGGRGGSSAPAPAAPAPAAPQGGSGQSFEEWSHSNTTGGHGCNPDGSCGIG